MRNERSKVLEMFLHIGWLVSFWNFFLCLYLREFMNAMFMDVFKEVRRRHWLLRTLELQVIMNRHVGAANPIQEQ